MPIYDRNATIDPSRPILDFTRTFDSNRKEHALFDFLPADLLVLNDLAAAVEGMRTYRRDTFSSIAPPRHKNISFKQ